MLKAKWFHYVLNLAIILSQKKQEVFGRRLMTYETFVLVPEVIRKEIPAADRQGSKLSEEK